MRQLSIDQFENEGRRVSMGTNSVEKPQRTPLFERHNSDPGVHKAIIQSLSSWIAMLPFLLLICWHKHLTAARAFPVTLACDGMQTRLISDSCFLCCNAVIQCTASKLP